MSHNACQPSATVSPQPSHDADSEDEQQLLQQVGPGQGLTELSQQSAQPDALDALRQEQTRMKAEYDRMEVNFGTTQLRTDAFHSFLHGPHQVPAGL